MYKFNWNGNIGRFYPDPGKVEQAECGICGTPMNVERNVNRATSYVEEAAHGAHLHDCFTCPHIMESWHRKIVALKIWAALNEDLKKETIETIENLLTAIEGGVR